MKLHPELYNFTKMPPEIDQSGEYTAIFATTAQSSRPCEHLRKYDKNSAVLLCGYTAHAHEETRGNRKQILSSEWTLNISMPLVMAFKYVHSISAISLRYLLPTRFKIKRLSTILEALV